MFWDRLDQTSGFHGNQKLLNYNEKNVMIALTPSFFIGSSLNLQVTTNSVWSYLPLSNRHFSH